MNLTTRSVMSAAQKTVLCNVSARYAHGVSNTVRQNSSVFLRSAEFAQMSRQPSAMTRGQLNFATTKSSSS